MNAARVSPPPLDEYAAELVRLVQRDASVGDLPPLAEIGTWDNLHNYCDANEYLVEADRKFGLSDEDLDERLDYLNEAVEHASQELFAPARAATYDRWQFFEAVAGEWHRLTSGDLMLGDDVPDDEHDADLEELVWTLGTRVDEFVTATDAAQYDELGHEIIERPLTLQEIARRTAQALILLWYGQ